MYFDCAVNHAVDGLVDYDGGMGLFHDFIDLVALGADEQRDHALRYENDDGESFVFYFFELLVDIVEQKFGALVLFLHFFVIYLALL